MNGNRWVMNVVVAVAAAGVIAGCRRDQQAPAPPTIQAMPQDIRVPSTREAAADAGEFRALAAMAAQSPFARTGEAAMDPAKTLPISAEATALLGALRNVGREDHLSYLLEYGLRLHLSLLRETGLARELPVKENLALAELVRLAKIEQYASAHEAGWLNSQFYGPFTRRGWSSYQIYIWCKENVSLLVEAPNSARIAALLEAIDATGASGVGGKGVCHYDCR